MPRDVMQARPWPSCSVRPYVCPSRHVRTFCQNEYFSFFLFLSPMGWHTLPSHASAEASVAVSAVKFVCSNTNLLTYLLTYFSYLLRMVGIVRRLLNESLRNSSIQFVSNLNVFLFATTMHRKKQNYKKGKCIQKHK